MLGVQGQLYLHAPAAGPRQITFTTDADLALDPDLLTEVPDVGRTLLDAGDSRGPNPGAFIAAIGIEIEIMVPEGAAAPSRRRSVSLPGQYKSTARRTYGVELALLDFT